eukprot:TRINITY_DN65707_c0_g1_i1.p1 TRINITY_DN65707_c0_g1~~TRINITY_DN65707_c0_g1_i1.p1  ORF type:complete len:357 (-),score=55.60 TRINITY_DN65707_c0_g1_i1:252-1322(-)
MGRSLTYVVVIRHGERLDEADRQAWRNIRTMETQYDPPLTQNGWTQAELAGRAVSSTIRLQDDFSGISVYSSPTMRTMATAAAVAKQLRVPTVLPAYGLNCCAAAKMVGVASSHFDRKPTEEMMSGVVLGCWPPLGNVKQIDERQRRGLGTFVESVSELAAQHRPGEAAVMITHREGIWDLLRHIGERPSGKYCSVHYFTYDHETRALDYWNASERSRKALSGAANKEECSTPEAKANGLSSPEKPEKRQSTRGGSEVADCCLESNLSRGSGSVTIHRSGAPGVLLWVTPGVRGNWAPGGQVPNGEVVELLSAPQASENDEGDFVLVRRACGIEGWTKLKNVQLPPLPGIPASWFC